MAYGRVGLWLAGLAIVAAACRDVEATTPDVVDAGGGTSDGGMDAAVDANGHMQGGRDAAADANGHVDGGGNPEVQVSAFEQTDTDCNGTPESCIAWTYDRFGNETSRSSDDCRGGSRRCSVSLFDDMGRALGLGVDDDCDGVADAMCTVSEYDAEGRVHRTEGPAFDELYSCYEPKPWCVEYFYDGDDSRSEVDVSCDGTVDQCTEEVFDSETGRGRSSFTWGCGDTPSGCGASVTTTANGIRRRVHGIDDDCDGTPDRACAMRAFDARDADVGSHSDDDCDGRPESQCTRVTYNEAGQLTGYFSNRDCGGVDEYASTYEYDASGNEITNVSGGCTKRSSYDEAGRLIRELYSPGCGGGAYDRRITYDDTGNVVTWREATDDDGDAGVSGRDCWTRTYDVHGNVTSSVHDDDCDGTPNARCVTTTRQYE